MSQPQFRYNPKTLRYERVRFSIWRSGGTLIAYSVFGILFFAGLNLLQNLVIETKKEKSLAAENKALAQYKVVLAGQIESSNQSLLTLKEDESKLHEKLFEAPIERESSLVEKTAPRVAQDDDWSDAMDLINKRFKALSEQTVSKNFFYGDRLSLDKSDVPTLIDFPSTAPVAELNDQNLVSGFGVRINPFHKGNYHHDGIDIALAKGTEILSTGNGQVINFAYSQLEAGFGNYVEIDHGNGLVTRYSHLDQINVTWGQKIKQGQVIGLSGSSGGSVAPHLHYEVIKFGKNLDPLTYIMEGINAEKHHQLALKSKIQNQSLD
ncbi:peptidase [Cytophagales bacterium WSM2-2]|nr:peptidase [Cytophagales bacterium WSM2-2]